MKVRTAAGTSERSYTHVPGELEIDGEKQGKGDVMGLWALVSDTILRTHNKYTKGVTLRHVANDMISQRSADAYVDDTDTLEQAGEHETMQEEQQEEESEGLEGFDESLLSEVHGVEDALHNLQDSA